MLSKLSFLSKIFKFAVISDTKLQQLSSIPSFSKQIKYASLNWLRLTSGSSRVIFDYSPDYVLKLAKNEKGISQNSVENYNFIQNHYKDIIANVIDSDPNNKWLVVEKASKMTIAQFKSITGIDFQNFCNYINDRFNLSKHVKYNVINKEELDNNIFIYEVVDLMANFNMPPGDITRKNSWGIVKNKVVLIDYGLTMDNYNEYYK